MAASVWNKLVRLSEPPSLLLAVIGRDLPEITPVVTVFWNCPSALPIATTLCPTSTLSESPSSAALRFLAENLIKARSLLGSVATTLASLYSVLSLVIILKLSPPSTTCLFVITSPSSVTIIPVPAPSLVWVVEPVYGSTLLELDTILTTEGPTFLATFATAVCWSITTCLLCCIVVLGNLRSK